MGNVRPDHVKKIAKEMIKSYPDKFTVDFESNKQLVSSLINVSSTGLRNRIAGYITRLMVISKTDESEGALEEETR